MKKNRVLFINACISNNKPSRTKRLCDTLLEEYKKVGDIVVEEVKVTENTIKPLDCESLELRYKLIEESDFDDSSFDLAYQFAKADIIIVGAPYWDLSFPAQLKAYIENIMVTNLTFRYTEIGVEGLCKADKLFYITTSGGFINDKNFGYDYIVGVANMLGITNTECISAQGLDIEGNNVADIMQTAMDQIKLDRRCK